MVKLDLYPIDRRNGWELVCCRRERGYRQTNKSDAGIAAIQMDLMELPTYALEYDEKLDAISSLEILTEMLPRVISIPHYWKWVVLSLHSALQGFMVLALQRTDALGALTEETKRAWLEAYESGTVPTKRARLEYFMPLYAKIKSDAMLFMSNSKSFTPSPSQDESVKRLNIVRSSFVHYVPALSLMDTRVWANLVLETVPIVEFLVFESNSVFFHDSVSSDKVRGLCGLAKSQAAALLNHYGAEPPTGVDPAEEATQSTQDA